MKNTGLLIYGGGNCELAASLKKELLKLANIDDISVFARGYIFGNSCLAMYKRFKSIRDEIGAVDSGGVYEYLCIEDEKLTIVEMQMRDASNHEEFEGFLEKGMSSIAQMNIVLIVIGQSSMEGILLDFFGERPSIMSYTQMLHSITQVAKKHKKRIQLVLDIPHWHPVKLPYIISRYERIDSLFIYERSEKIDILPITKYIKALKYNNNRGENKILNGYKIDNHPILWDVCKWKWKRYVDEPCSGHWKEFYNVYKGLVTYTGNKYNYYHHIGKNIEFTEEVTYLSDEDLIKYFRDYEKEELDDESVKIWFQEMKSCIDYYKL